MFLPHSCSMDLEDFKAVDGGVALSRYYQILEEEETQKQDQNFDSHDRFFSMAKLEYQQGRFREETENQILESTMTKDKRLQEMLKKFFTPKDYFKIISSSGTG